MEGSGKKLLSKVFAKKHHELPSSLLVLYDLRSLSKHSAQIVSDLSYLVAGPWSGRGSMSKYIEGLLPRELEKHRKVLI